MKLLLAEIRHNKLLWLLGLAPVLFALEALKPKNHAFLFVLSVLTIIPLGATRLRGLTVNSKRLGIIPIALVWCTSWIASAQAQTLPQPPQVASNKTIDLGGRGLAPPEATSQEASKDENEGLKFSAKAGVASDYVYRGTTLSDHKPALGAAIEATFARFYAWTTAATVRLPTQPDAELAFGGGIRQSIGDFDFDLGGSYFAYPGGLPGASSIDYWEAAFRSEVKLTESLRWAGGFAYSPNVSNTGAWSWYGASGLGYDLPARLLPSDLGVSFTAAAGYSWFGHQSAALGGFQLPAYLNWHAGVTFTYKSFNLDLRYHDTDLSKENCFVFTGDPDAGRGGHRDPITNPGGLISNWCGATVVAKAWVALN